MDNLLATIIAGLVIGENAKAYFVQKDGVAFMLDKAEDEHKIGDMIKGFAHTDVHQKARLTTADAATTRTTYGWGVVTEVRHGLGIFLDTEPTDKRFVISLDVLPDMKELWPKKGNKLCVHLDMGKKDCIWAIPTQPEVFQKMVGPVYGNMQNKKLRAIVYRLRLSGTFVYLPGNNMLDFIHPSERYAEPCLGEEIAARVIGFREIDRTLNLSSKPRLFEALESDSQMISTYLQSNGGFMTLNDKSSPADIKAAFDISKGQFKKALGDLARARKVKQNQFGTELVNEEK